MPTRELNSDFTYTSPVDQDKLEILVAIEERLIALEERLNTPIPEGRWEIKTSSVLTTAVFEDVSDEIGWEPFTVMGDRLLWRRRIP